MKEEELDKLQMLSGNTKLKPKSVKCMFVGYAGMGGYCLFNRTLGTIVTSCIIFDKGTSHRKHTARNDIGNLPSIHKTHKQLQILGILMPRQPVAP